MAYSPWMTPNPRYPLYTPRSGYGTRSGNYYYTQTSQNGGQWSSRPASQPQQGSVNSSSTSIYNNPTTTRSGGGGSPSDRDYDALGVARGDVGGYERVLREQQEEVARRENQVRNDINSGYDAYFSELDNMLSGLSGQQRGQEQIVNNSYNQGISDIEAQKTSSLADLETSRRKNKEQEVKTLNDIANNIRNLFQTGNVMLGTRGAGDSSASNQYSYAVTKLGSKQRGDVLSQTRSIENDIAGREADLNNIVTQEKAKLTTERDNNILSIAQWFQDKQAEIQQAKASGQISKGQSLAQLSTQLLNQAQQYLLQADADYKNKQSALFDWAANNSYNVNQLNSNLAAIGQYNVPSVQPGQMMGQPRFDAGGNLSAPTYGGSYLGRDELENPFI